MFGGLLGFYQQSIQQLMKCSSCCWCLSPFHPINSLDQLQRSFYDKQKFTEQTAFNGLWPKYIRTISHHYHWVRTKRHRLWFSTKTCSCYSTKTYVQSVILLTNLNLTSLSTTHIFMYMFLNEVKFNLRIRITLFIWVFVELQLHVFVENHNMCRFDCTQWL